MPHTPELLDRLNDALAVADAADDHLASAYIATPIAMLEARLPKQPQSPTSAE